MIDLFDNVKKLGSCIGNLVLAFVILLVGALNV